MGLNAYAGFNMTLSSTFNNSLYPSANSSMENTSLAATFEGSDLQTTLLLGSFYYVIENFGTAILDRTINNVAEYAISFGKKSVCYLSEGVGLAGAFIDDIFTRAVSFIPNVKSAEVPSTCDVRPYDEQLELLKKILENQEKELTLQKQTLEILKQMKEKDIKVKELEAGLPNLQSQLNLLNDKISSLYDEILETNIQRLNTKQKFYEVFPSGGGRTVDNPEHVKLEQMNKLHSEKFCQFCKRRKEIITKIDAILKKIEDELKINLSARKVTKSCEELDELRKLNLVPIDCCP